MSKNFNSPQSNTLKQYIGFYFNETPKVNNSSKPSTSTPNLSESEQKTEDKENQSTSTAKDDLEEGTPSKKRAIGKKQPKTPSSILKRTPIKLPHKKKPEATPSSKDSDDEDLKSKRKRLRAIVSDSDSDTEPATSKKPKSNLSTFLFSKSAKTTTAESNTEVSIPSSSKVESLDFEKVWLHTTLDFLKPDKMLDKNRHQVGHPDYDPTTLYIPDSFLQKQTPAMRQWWLIKSEHFDSVIFFKVGKFYELYHMDAVIGVNNLGFSYMKGEFAHSGFPEIAYGKMASSLIQQGFKVARTEQTETPEMMAERLKTSGKKSKFDKVVSREVCQVSTKGSCLYGAQLTESKQHLPSYMLALCEDKQFNLTTNKHKFGICLVDSSIGTFCLGQFVDDKHCSQLLALLAERNITLILTERGRMSSSVTDLLKKTFHSIQQDALTPETQFYSAETTLKTLQNGHYFENKEGEFEWPETFNLIMQNGLPLNDYKLSISALGACVWYLNKCKIDSYLLPMKKFDLYNPVDTVQETKSQYMILDHITLKNLNILGSEGSLMSIIDHCSTAFGKRLLQEWICRPLSDLDSIQMRQGAVKELRNNTDLLKSVQSKLSKLPDLQRHIAKIHVFGNRICAKSHPDSRAILYEAKIYNKRKILTLLETLQAFKLVGEIVELFENCESALLKLLTSYPPLGKFIDLSEHLKFFDTAFDHKKVKETGKIIPQEGMDEEYDNIEIKIKNLQQKLTEYLQTQEKVFGCKVTYFGTDKKRYQLEVPQNKCRKVSHTYSLEGSRKGSKPVNRYSTPTTKQFLVDMMKLETEKTKIIHDLNRRIFEKFSDRMQDWETAIHCIAMLDALCSLAEYARSASYEMYSPDLMDFSTNPKIDIKNGQHPCVLKPDFIPNDTLLEGKARLMILTGPNMGGKSTLMRQVALIIVLAQIGSYVPASYCKMNLVDRIFTRIGASDNIMQHQSTFLVELTEASTILRHCTTNSFVLVDELGRGTSTHDGTAIATAYVKKLIETGCRCMFTTHYHSLVNYYRNRDDIQIAHMACIVENEDEADNSVTFLYKLAEGSSSKSHALNAAKLAGLPISIIQKARKLTDHLEELTKYRKIFQDLYNVPRDSIVESIAALQI